MERQSLSDLLRESNENLPRIEGLVDVVLRNADGSIAEAVHKRNMVTELFRMLFASNDHPIGAGNVNVFIHENAAAMHAKRTVMRTTMSNTWAQIVTPTRDGPNRLWTFQTVFAAPGTARVFQTVGISRNRSTTVIFNGKTGPTNIMAATVLGSPISQSTSQTLEVTYRLAFLRT